jgi:hypothetical protein
MRSAHEVTAWLLIGFNAVAGVLCLAAYRWPRLRGRGVWVLVIVAQSLVFIQATLGTILARQENTELGDMHALYGFSAIVAVMIMYGYRTSPFLKGKQLVLYGLGCLFVMGLGIRNLYLHG